MIIVLEGISAAGKTTYARQFGEVYWIPEFPGQEPVPTAADPIELHAHYWVEHNVRRFQAAQQAEAEHGFAICDTDPFKSHFDWTMARAGHRTMALFDAAKPIAREAFAQQRLGFANRYYVKRIEPDIARAQKEGDPTRSRRRFEMHLTLQPHLMDWYVALDLVLPGRIEFGFPEQAALQAELESKAPEEDPRRFDVSVLDALFERLPG